VSFYVAFLATLATLGLVASIFKRKDSPYWWLRKKDITGKWVGSSTKYRVDNQLETKRARQEAAQGTADELGDVAFRETERWDHWVDRFLATHCRDAGTLRGYQQSWHWIRSYLAEKRIVVACQLTYQDVFGFIGWRAKTGRKREIGKSTALRDIKVLRVNKRYAVRTGLATGNPCDRLGIRRPTPKVKRELTDEDIGKIYAGLKREDLWMTAAFALCLHTGCRIGEADLELVDLDRERGTITFKNPKGGTQRAFTTMLAPELDRVIRWVDQNGGAVAAKPPKAASQLFRKFFARNGIKGVSIHCTRVTFVSRLARSTVPERVARLAVNHSSEVVHRTYQRLGVDDLRQIEGAVTFPVMPDTTLETPGTGPSPRKAGTRAS
jgi:integrase